MAQADPVQRLVLTPGEPAGIGPDLVIELANTALDCELVCIADPSLLEQRAAQIGKPLKLRIRDVVDKGMFLRWQLDMLEEK